MIVGRAAELARIERLLAEVRAGDGGPLVIRGEAGIGKTALLDHAAARAADLRVLRGVGIESEIRVPYAGLHLLLHPFLDRIGGLPRPQAEALRAAFGLADGQAGERFLVGAATLSLLSELAADRPLLCLVDDAQWFGPASADALLFAARRLRVEPVAVVFAVRADAGPFSAPGIEVMELPPLDRASAIALLDERAEGLAGQTRARVLAEACGNPLAIIEFTAALTDRRAWSLPVEPLPVARQVQDAYRARIVELPEAAQRLLVLAAADDTASASVVMGAALRLGLSVADLAAAEQAGLIEWAADTIRFRHPLIRAAAYRGAPRAWLIAAHRALADTLDDDRRVWHLAAATGVPDERIAAELEQAAGRAERRGGSAAVASALERAAQLSTDREQQGRRLIGAARAAYDAGWLDRAAESSAAAARLTTDESLLAQATWVRAQVAYELESPAAAAALMLDGAARIVGSHPEQAVSILTDAMGCAKDAGAHDLIRRGADHLAEVSLDPDSELLPVAEGMIGLRDLLDGATGNGVARMAELVAAAAQGRVSGLVERVLAGYLALIVADDEAATDIFAAMVAQARREGSLAWLPYAQEPLAITLLLRGRFGEAEAAVTEALSVSAELGQETQRAIMTAIPAWLAAVTGDADGVRSDLLHDAVRHPTNAALATWALGLLDLCRGRHEAAADRLEAVCSGPARHDFLIRAIPDHVEAAVRAGRPAQAATYVPRLENWATHTRQAHAAALAHRCRALLTDDAEAHYEAALKLHDGRPYDHARTTLLYAEWLRRHRQRTRARTHLAEALTAFEQLGARAWAERARAELAVLGDRPVAQPQHRDPLARLTAQERQVVRLAAAGLSNRDIAAQLFLSPRTVGHHLYRAYPKLGITKRMELAEFLGPEA
ncbi:ATP-binding protein [Nonomuraea sp. NPDC050556]|uniref:ATP-binding protein n=1 Tax=Nonomuraea sp. NPDC050556 TaxID=3364369 RepID=UPI00378EB617